MMGKKTTGKKVRESEVSKNYESITSEVVTDRHSGHEGSDNDFEYGATQSEVMIGIDVDVNKKKKEKNTDEVRTDDVDVVGGNVDGLIASRIESVVEGKSVEDKGKKKKKKGHDVSGNDFQFGDGGNEADAEGDVDLNNTENEEDRKKKKKKKRKLEVNEDENGTQKAKKSKRINDDSLQENGQAEWGNNSEFEARKKSKNRHTEDMNDDGSGNFNSMNNITGDVAETWNRKESDQKKKKNKQRKGNGDDDGTRTNSGTNEEAGRERESLERNITENVENGRKDKKKKKDHNDSQSEKHHNVNRRVEDMGGHAFRNKDGKKDKKKKSKSVKKSSGGDKKVTKQSVKPSDRSKDSAQKSAFNKKVSFSDHVQVFPCDDAKNPKDDGFVRGKRFSKEEDEIIKKAVMNYIEARRLGEEGVNMVLNCRSHPEVKHCWKEIGAALPWRPYESVKQRAHIIYQRGEDRKWTPEELELVRKFHEKHGPKWQMLADALGKHRFHVKDTWRRIRLPNQKKGQWSQEEYQRLFDLVNMDLRIRAFGEKKTKHGMLRDNIGWEAISDELATRSNSLCCIKWYGQLTSPMVAEGKWADTDDFHLVNALSSLDACCMDDVDWDNLLEHRSGCFCRKRWNQMVKHLGTNENKSFPEQVEILSTRYCPDVLEARETYNSKPQVD